MKIGATTIPAFQCGIILLALVDMKMPNPRTNQTRGKKFFFVIFDSPSNKLFLDG
jgi:hypothetical protein